MAAACVLPTGEQKAAQEPVGQGTGSSSTTSAVISCHLIIHAVVLSLHYTGCGINPPVPRMV